MKSQKLYLNLCSLKWDRLIWSLINNSNLTWLWISSAWKCNDWIKLGLKLLTNFFPQFLRIGTIVTLFNWSGDIPGCMQLSNTLFNYFKINLWDIFSILLEISLYIWVLLTSKDFRVFKISDSFMLIELNNDVVIEALFNVTSLKLCFIREHLLSKKWLKRLEFSLKLFPNWSIKSREGLIGIVFHLVKDLKKTLINLLIQFGLYNFAVQLATWFFLLFNVFTVALEDIF